MPTESTQSGSPPAPAIGLWLTVKQAAIRICASPSLIRKLIMTGKLSAANIGHGDQRAEWRIAVADLDRFMSGCVAPARRATAS